MLRLVFAALLVFATPARAQWSGVKLDLDWVTVGSPGNTCDAQPQGCFGAVAYEYQLGRFETTNNAYASFLSSVARTDTNALYSTSMDSDAVNGGITRSGVSGSFRYTVKAGFGNKPVTYVSFWDALRFANWLYNGQPQGAQDDTTTEDGAYTLTPEGIAANSITRNPGAAIFVPSEDEWFKGAYHGGGTTWFDYPAGSDAVTACTTPGATSNAANCNDAVASVSDVGAYTGSPSPSGTFDQGANVAEWNEGIPTSSTRRTAGGSWFNTVNNLSASNRDYATAVSQGDWAGFRVGRLGPPVDIVVSLDPGQASPPYTWSLRLSIASGYPVQGILLLVTGFDSFAINSSNPNVGGDSRTYFVEDPIEDGRDMLILQSVADGVAVASGPISDSLLGTFISSSATLPPVVVESCPEELCGLTSVFLTDLQPLPPSEFTVRAVGPPAPDSDGDGVLDPTDNCPVTANADQADGDGDRVGDICDNCTTASNGRIPPENLTTRPWMTLTGGQRDDDYDGYGNVCDAKFPGVSGVLVGTGDLTQFRASNGKSVEVDTCGTSGTRPCAIFDVDQLYLLLGTQDLTRFRLLNGKAPGPKCEACPLECVAGATGTCGPIP